MSDSLKIKRLHTYQDLLDERERIAKAFEKELATLDWNPKLGFLCGWLHQILEQFDKACKAFERAKNYEGDDPYAASRRFHGDETYSNGGKDDGD